MLTDKSPGIWGVTGVRHHKEEDATISPLEIFLYTMRTGRHALPAFVLILVVRLTVAASVHAEPQYMVLVPCKLFTEVPEKICLHLHHLNETVTVSAFLGSNVGNRKLFGDLVVDKDLFQCISFTLPRYSFPMQFAFLFVQIQGPTHTFSKSKGVLVKNTESIVIVQTDKPMYKPGQSVKFRVVSVDKNLHPLNELFPLVYIEDPKTNRIMQWQNVTSENGIKQLSFSLSSEPIRGVYQIVVLKQSRAKKEHFFSVEEYVLPRFEVQVKCPKTVSLLDKEVNVTVCGTYTYGKPVRGHVKLNICRKYLADSYFGHFSGPLAECEEISHQLDNQGCITQPVITYRDFTDWQKIQRVVLHVNANITEEGTGLEFTGTGTTEVRKARTNLVVVRKDLQFRRGIPFVVQLLLEKKGVPIVNEHVSLHVDKINSYTTNATTDEHGLVEFSINTTDIEHSSFTFNVYYKEQGLCFKNYCIKEELRELVYGVDSVFSFSKSFVYLEPVAGALPCGQIHTVHARYILNGQVLGELREMIFYYLITTKGSIVQTGTHAFLMEPGESQGHFNLSVPMVPHMAPVAKMLLYAILPNREVIADSAQFKIANCLYSKVGLSFSPAQSLPASQAHLHITAAPQSLCALRAVDQSVLLQKPEAELSESSIYDLLSMMDFDYITTLNHLTNDPENCQNNEHRDFDRISYSLSRRNDKDAFRYMESMGLIAFTNLKIRDPKLCPDHTSLPRAVPFMLPQLETSVELYKKPLTETVRKYFPETWIWDLVLVNSSGVAEVGVTVPDTITEWKAGALCLSPDVGLGLSRTASLRAFQPFFVELTMPYSVVRGEAFTLRATMLSYLPDCIGVSVQLEASPDFTAVPVAGDQDSYCVCANGRQTVSWLVTPKSLGTMNFSVSAEMRQSPGLCEAAKVPEAGKKDTVVKGLLVEPEGIKKEYTFNSLLCASDAGKSEKLSLKLPPRLVNDSARAYFSVFGDILSSSIKNIQDLLQMPYGCGEQNMILFAPNIYILKYLNETQQLTQEIKSEAIGYLNAGYQRELNYKHPDGSYSAFGHQQGKIEGNTWLTAFVLKTFAQARAFIFIDETHVTHALTWLSRRQKHSGCFRSSGTLFHNDLKGGVDDEVTLSAYITIALLEIPLPATHPVVSKALICMNSAWETTKEGTNGSHVYTKALLAYAFALAGNQEKKREIMKSLNEEAVEEDNSVHWERPQKPREPEGHLYQPRAPPAEVEMTAYVLLALLTAQTAPTPADLTSAARIVKWITKQQNSYGGFSSTQDTVVALHALSRYGAATFAGTGKTSLVTIQSSGAFSTKFQVDNSNHLLLQQVPLPNIPGEYEINVSGGGCVFTQTALKYNVFSEKEESGFALQVQTIPQTCDGPEAHKRFQISLEFSYTGRRPVSNMVIADVKMISGFSPLKPTVKMLERSDHVSRTEVSNSKVLIYVDQVTNETLSFSFTVVQDIPVRNLKPALVKVYDYYETGEAAFAEYSAPCSTDEVLQNV
ncbi:alpha-1-inhibitor 3-like isoform X2 [Fukomys damarensis]|uniref:alpha-1-inhibitor 3-like isoform X2 n=1 Tax=Fukomys damarensis TaxID=885580 RepID=UPI00053FCC8F|nr:alpha-1-inhibitor 3-like isoform X2 [Fukomys damarensis]